MKGGYLVFVLYMKKINDEKENSFMPILFLFV